MLPTLVIVYLRKKGDSLGPYLRDWDKAVGDRLQVFEFDELKSWDSFPSATYIFTDVETLDETQRAWVTELWGRLEAADGPVRLLNDPRRMLGRYEFLRLLHERGVNNHRAYRLHEAHRARFPVFLRRERRHWGVTRVLRSRQELVRAVVWARRKGWPLNDLLVVEFIDTVNEDGSYHKYGAYYIDGQVIPRSLLFRPDWMVKSGKRDEAPVPEQMEQELDFIETNPHEAWIKDVFTMAAIDYGRIDYAMAGDQPTVWEINTNPTPIAFEEIPPYVRPVIQRFADRYGEALVELDSRLN